MLQEFDIEIKYRKGSENSVLNYLSKSFLENADDLILSRASLPWFAHIVDYLVTGEIPSHWSKQEKDRFFLQARHYNWEDP